jgi:YD repeat-containing protein
MIPLLKFAYDAAGQLTQMTYPDGRVVGNARDALERLTGVQRTVNQVNAAILIGAQYRADGQPSSLTLGNGLVESRGYDPVGRLTSQLVGAVDSRSYGFDAVGNMTFRQTSAETDQCG